MQTSLVFLFVAAVQVQPAAAGLGKALEDELNKQLAPLNTPNTCPSIENRAIDFWCLTDHTGVVQAMCVRCRNKKAPTDPNVAVSKIQEGVIKRYFDGSKHQENKPMHAIVKGWINKVLAAKCENPAPVNQAAGQEYAKAYMEVDKIIAGRKVALTGEAVAFTEEINKLVAGATQTELDLVNYLKFHPA